MGDQIYPHSIRLPHRARSRGLALLILLLVFRGNVAVADEPAIAERMPSTTRLFFEINKPEALQRLIRDGMCLPEKQRLLPDCPWNLIAVAVDPKHRGLLFTFDSLSDTGERVVCASTHAVLQACARSVGLGSLVFRHKVGSATLWHVGPVGWFDDGHRTIVSTRRSLTFDAWRTIHDPRQPSLAETSDFQTAMAALPDDRVATCFVRQGDHLGNGRLLLQIGQATAAVAIAESNLPRPIRRLAVQLARKPVEEVRFLAAALSDREPKPHVTVVLPAESPRLAGALRVLAAIPQQGRASVPLIPSNTMLSISTFLNRQAIALAVETLFNADGLSALKESNPEFATLVQGLSFTVDASRQIEPRVQVVIARRPTATKKEREPRLELPAMAVIFVPTNPKRLKQMISLAFMGAMNEVNKTAEKENRPSYRLVGKRVGDVMVTSGVMRERKEGQRPTTPLLAGVSPTIAFLDRRFIFATDRQLAVDLVTLAAEQPDATIDSSLRLNVGPVEILRAMVDSYEAVLTRSKSLRFVHQLAGPLMDGSVVVTRQLLQHAPSPKLKIDQPPIDLPFTLEVLTP